MELLNTLLIPYSPNFYIRFNGSVRYIKFDKDSSHSKKFEIPHFYSSDNYSFGEWVALDICVSWEKYVEDNCVYDIGKYNFLLHKTYPVDLIGLLGAWDIVNRMPEDATHYNYLSKTYQKKGEHGASLTTHGWNSDGTITWVDSYHGNDFLDTYLICLSKLYSDLRKIKAG